MNNTIAELVIEARKAAEILHAQAGELAATAMIAKENREQAERLFTLIERMGY